MALRYLSGVLVLLAALLGGRWVYGLLRSDRSAEEYRIELLFRSARGLKEGASVLYRGLRVGEVRRIRLSPDGEHASVELALDETAANTVATGTTFWIVTPRFQGVAGGASGLETLIKDSYVAYVTPAQRGVLPIPNGSRIPGAEDPPDQIDPTLDAPQPGDLLFAVVFAQSHGLKPGCRVRHRGIVTGEVRRVDLAPDGRAVLVEGRIRRRQRNTLTTRSQVWVARPRLEGAMLSGFAVEELDSLFEPYLAYFSAEDSAGQPVADGARFVGLDVSPSIPMRAPSAAAPPAASTPPPASLEQRLVRVLFQCVEKNTILRNEEISVSGTGLLFRDGQGRPGVLAPRTLTDGAYFVVDHWPFQRPDIGDEQIRVQFPDGSVHPAGRVWVAPDGRDLSLLLLPPELEAKAPEGDVPLDFGTESTKTESRDAGAFELIAAPGPDGSTDRMSVGERDGKPDLSGTDLRRFAGALVLRGGRVVGFVGRPSGHAKTATAILLSDVPAELRPVGRSR